MIPTRARIKLIRESNDWLTRHRLANDEVSHLDLHDLRKYALRGLRLKNPTSRDGWLARFGQIMVEAIERGDATLFRRMADAIDANNSHRATPDKLRAAIINFCVPQDGEFTMRDIVQHLRGLGLAPANARESVGLDDFRRRIYTLTKELRLRVKGESGRPKKTVTRTKKKAALKS